MKQMNPLEQWVVVNALGFAILLATLANETYKVFNTWVSIIGYSVCAIIFSYTFFVLMPRFKKLVDEATDATIPGDEKK